MQNAVALGILVVILILAVYGIVKRIRFGSSCCGTKAEPEKRIKVRDKNKAHYPYSYVLGIEGMRCKGCALRIENAFNQTEGKWAKADVKRKEVKLLSKRDETENDLQAVIEGAGYRMVSGNNLPKG